MDVDAKIKNDLKDHLERTAREIRAHDGWDLINMPELSERELIDHVAAEQAAAAEDLLEHDEQTRTFCKFISIGTNFASLTFRDRMQTLPELINSIKDLLVSMEAEIKEFSEIAACFQCLIHSFAKLVMNTKHNMQMALPHLEQSIIHMSIMSEALMPDAAGPLSDADSRDIQLALTSMSSGIHKLLEHAKSSREHSTQLDDKINELKDNIQSKITVTKSRIGFSKLLPKLGAIVGTVSGAGSASAVVESMAFGGAGALVLGGFSFPPIGAVLVASAIGAVSIGSVLFLIIRLWHKHQHKALNYLRAILDKLNKLNSANLAFMDYMNKSEEDVNKVLESIEFLKLNVSTGSQRYRQTNASVCRKAIQSTNDMIECIGKIADIDMKEWVDANVPSPPPIAEAADKALL